MEPNGSKYMDWDISGIPNANAQAPYMLVIEQQCDLEHWHYQSNPIVLPCWGAD